MEGWRVIYISVDIYIYRRDGGLDIYVCIYIYIYIYISIYICMYIHIYVYIINVCVIYTQIYRSNRSSNGASCVS
jgi:hypothetical protein